jgi:hypothetical protein
MTDTRKTPFEYSVTEISAKTILWLSVGVGRRQGREGDEPCEQDT